MISRGFLLKVVFIFATVFFCNKLEAQVIVDADSVGVVQSDSKKGQDEKIHSPRKATIYSAILPGLGQVYNKKYWKIPLVYGGFAAIGYFINWNNDNYQLFRKGYQDLTDGNPETQDYLKIEAVRRNNFDLENPNQFNTLRTALISQQDYYRRNRDLLIISFIGFYGLNIIDASVDAHLYDFDISDDLTLNWQPSALRIEDNLVYCINLKFSF